MDDPAGLTTSSRDAPQLGQEMALSTYEALRARWGGTID